MIYDDIARWETYRFSKAVAPAFEFLKKLDLGIPDGEYEISGRSIYASVMTYDTAGTPPEMLETHRKYVDIQYAVTGVEVLFATLLNTNGMQIRTPYDPLKDAEFFYPPEQQELARLEMRPGMFAVFFPWDAHLGRGASIAAGAMTIRKVVVKTELSLFK